MDLARYIAIKNYLTDKTYPLGCDTSIDKKTIRNLSRRYIIQGNKLFIKRKTVVDGKKTLVAAQEVLHEGTAEGVIKMVHEEGHMGLKNTWIKLRLQYEGYKLYDQVREVVKNCGVCQRRAKKRILKHELAHPIPTPSRPFFMVGIDAVGPLEETANGNKYLLVAIDHLTRWPVAAAVPSIDEVTTSSFLFNCIVKDFGVPTYLLSDRGSNFVSYHIKAFLKNIGCTGITTTAHRPQVNGMCERMNQTLVNTIAKLAADKKDRRNWDLYLPLALLTIRCVPNDATQYSPSYLLYGYVLRTPVTWPAPRLDYVEGELDKEISERVKVIQGIMVEQRQDAERNSADRKAKWKKKHDQGITVVRFPVGSQVLLREMYSKGKFEDTWVGPYTIIKVNSNGTYWLDGLDGRRISGAVNGSMMKPWHEQKRLIPEVTHGPKSMARKFRGVP